MPTILHQLDLTDLIQLPGLCQLVIQLYYTSVTKVKLIFLAYNHLINLNKLGYYENGEYQHDCTGSILTPTIVITAAHCTLEEEK